MFNKESLQTTETELAEHAVSANFNPRQRSHLDKLVREWQALKGELKAHDLAASYDLALIRRIKAKQEEIKEFSRTKEIFRGSDIVGIRREQLIEWAQDEIELREENTGEWVDMHFVVKDDEDEILIYRNGDFKSVGCKYLTHLPDKIKFDGALLLKFCPRLVRLADYLIVKDLLYLECCPELRRLADFLEIGRDLIISNCPNLQGLPENLSVDGSVTIEHCNRQVVADAWRLKKAGKIKGRVEERGN